MKKHYLLLIVAIFICAAADAAERTWQQKRQIALSVLGKQAQTRAAQGGELKLLKEAKSLSVLGYDGGGFAVISNDDRQEAVLGWSANKFDTDDMPDGLRWWLNAADEALSAQANYARQYIPTEVDPSLPAAVDDLDEFETECVHRAEGIMATYRRNRRLMYDIIVEGFLENGPIATTRS